MSENERIDTGYAALKTDSDNVPIQVSGVAIGEGDITSGDSGKKTLWPKETLQNAPLRGGQEALEGQPIATDDNHTAEGTKAQTPSDAVRGEISWAGYKPNVGVVYEGEVDDPDIARSVENDRLEVSPLVSRELEALEGETADKYREKGYDVDEADFVATEINRWRDLATVVNGAAPSNEITVGGTPMKAEALHETVDELQDSEALKEVSGVEFSGTSGGKLDESEIDENYGDHALYGEGENKGDYSYWVVDADGNLRRENVESAWQLGCRGQCPSDDAHDERVRALAQEFDDPPIDMDGESMGTGITDPKNWEACNVDLPETVTHDDAQHGSNGQSSVAGTSEATMTNELSDTETAVLEAADSVEEPVEALEEYAATEQPIITNGEQYEALEANVSEVRDVLTEALSEKTELKDSTIEALSFDALCDEFRDDEGDLQVEALTQVPETGEPDSEDTESGAEALSDDADMDKAEALYSDMQEFGVDHEDNIVEALGVEDFDTATEVLD